MGVRLKLFPELYGFVIYSEQPLLSFIKENNVGLDLLSFMTSSNIANEITAQGIVIPIFDVQEGLYDISLKNSCSLNDANKIGIFESHGKLSICGMGYLAHFDVSDLRKREKIKDFSINKGFFDLYCTIDSINEFVSLNLQPQK